MGFYSAIRREVTIGTFNDWKEPPPGFCEVDMVDHGGTSVTGSFIQTLTMVDVATGWTECMPLVTRDGNLRHPESVKLPVHKVATFTADNPIQHSTGGFASAPSASPAAVTVRARAAISRQRH